MVEGFSLVKKHRDSIDLNVVPILDMFISVIFFLLLATTFLQFTKQSVPPSSVSTIKDPVAPPPVAAKLVAVNAKKNLKLILSWAGTNPGQETKIVTLENDEDKDRDQVIQTTGEMIDEFSKTYATEKTLQIGLGADVSYQNLISIMDAVKEKMPDMVLFSYAEAQARANKAPKD